MVEVEKFLRRSKGDDASGVEKGDARGEKKSFANVVRDENDGLAETAGEGAELALKFGAGDRIERAKRLVHKKDGRIGRESARDADALALAAREFTRTAIGKFSGIETY